MAAGVKVFAVAVVVLSLAGCVGSPAQPPEPEAEPVSTAAAALAQPLFYGCAAAADCTARTGTDSTCFQGTCQPAALTAKYWAATQEASRAPKVSYNWSWVNATTLQRSAPVASVTLSGGAAMVADGPFHTLQYASGTTDFAALDLAGGQWAIDPDALDLTASAGVGSVPLTISVFVSQSASTPQDNTWDAVVGIGDTALLDVQSSTGAVRLGLWNWQAMSYSSFETPPGALRKGEWHQLRATCSDVAPYTISIYVDERLVASGPPSRGPMNRTPHATQKYELFFSNSEPFSFRGRIAGAWVVRAVMPPLAAEARLRAAFNMDGPLYGVQNGANKYTLQAVSHAKVADNNVMFYSSPQTLDAPVVDASNPLSGLSTRVFDTTVAQSTSFKGPAMLGPHLKYLTQASYEAWFNRTVDTGAQEYVLSSQNGYVAITASDKILCGFADSVGPTNKPTATGTTTIALNQWYHVLCSFDGLTTKAWLNGALEGSAKVTTGTPGYYAAGAGNLFVGVNLTSSMRGRVTGVRVWDRARAPDATCASLCDADDATVPGATACYDTATQARSTCSGYRGGLPRCQAAGGDRCTATSAPDQPCYYNLLFPFRVSTCGHMGGSASCAQTCNAQTSCSAACTSYQFDPAVNANVGTATTCGASHAACSSVDWGNGLVASGDMVLIDPQAVTLPTRPDMSLTGGRLSNVVLTRYLEYPGDVDGTASRALTLNGFTARFAAVCSDWLDADGDLNRSSVTLILVVRDENDNYVNTYYGSNLGAAEHTGVTTGRFHYTLYAYSTRLNTAFCDLRLSLTAASPQSQAPVVPARHIGGTMIRVGPFPPAGDSFEVQTPGNAADANERTRMALFSVAGDSSGYLAQAPLRSATVSATDLDARITVPVTHPDYRPTSSTYPYDKVTNGYPAANFLLVGKAATDPAAGAPGHATVLRADVVHRLAAPSIQTASASGFNFTPLPIGPGRYTIGIDLLLAHPLGDLTSARGLNEIGYDGGAFLRRGQVNGPAFDYEVRCGAPGSAGTPASPVRHVPLGAFGSAESHRFYQDIEVTQATACWPHVWNTHPDLSSTTEWFAQRSAESARLRVAFLNMWYGSSNTSHLDDNEYFNAGDLLGPRGEPGPDSLGHPNAFADPDVRGPFQLDADVVGLTEMGDNVSASTGVGECDFERDVLPAQRDHFYDAVRPGDSRRWDNVWGYDERFLGSFNGAGAIFVADSQWPGASGASIRPAFDPSTWTEGIGNGHCQSHSHCLDPVPFDDLFSCTPEDETTLFDFGYIPARIKVRSNLATPQPILVVTMHPVSGGGSTDVDSRKASFHSMSTMLIQQLAGQWSAVNGGATAIDAQQPEQSPGNRIIFIGDSNLETTDLGEHYKILRELRVTWGYAIDLASAIDNAHGLGLTMHNAGDLACSMGLLNVPRWEALPFDVRWSPALDVAECNRSDKLQLAWWGRTFLRPTPSAISNGAGRYDVVFLIGRGWESDDPAKAYQILQRADVPVNPFAPTGKGVNTWGQSKPGAGPGNYKPRATVRTTANTEGSAALETDHTAIGGHLRIWAGKDAR